MGKNHGFNTPKQALKTDSAASCAFKVGVLQQKLQDMGHKMPLVIFNSFSAFSNNL
jgi:hypothetical protein